MLPFHTFPAPHLGFSKRPRQHPDLGEGRVMGLPSPPRQQTREAPSEDEAGGECIPKPICRKTGMAGPGHLMEHNNVGR